MKTLLLLVICSVLTASTLQAKDSISPNFTEKFGEVAQMTIEFVEKNNDYISQNLVKAKCLAKVVAVNGKPLEKPVRIEYRCSEGDFTLGSKGTYTAYEDIESLGQNREFDGIQQIDYRVRRFLRVKALGNQKQTKEKKQEAPAAKTAKTKS